MFSYIVLLCSGYWCCRRGQFVRDPRRTKSADRLGNEPSDLPDFHLLHGQRDSQGYIPTSYWRIYRERYWSVQQSERTILFVWRFHTITECRWKHHHHHRTSEPDFGFLFQAEVTWHWICEKLHIQKVYFFWPFQWNWLWASSYPVRMSSSGRFEFYPYIRQDCSVLYFVVEGPNVLQLSKMILENWPHNRSFFLFFYCDTEWGRPSKVE